LAASADFAGHRGDLSALGADTAQKDTLRAESRRDGGFSDGPTETGAPIPLPSGSWRPSSLARACVPGREGGASPVIAS
jgi:hypothetical protein